MPWFGKLLLFFSSWFPAYAMMGLLTFANSKVVGAVFFGLSAASIAVYFWLEKLILKHARRSLKVAVIERRDENVLMYIIAYLPPFFALDLTKWGQLSATLLFYVVFAATYVKLDMYYLNPMYVFRSFKTYNLKTDSGEEFTALVKGGKTVSVGDTVNYTGRDNVILIED